MNVFKNPRLAACTLAAVALAGGGAGVALYDSVGAGDRSVTTTTAAATAVLERSTTLSAGQIYRRNKKGVVEITVDAQAQGTGFVYDREGDIVTNQHVVDGASSITVELWDSSTYNATVVGEDASTDLAVIRIEAPAGKLDPVKLGDSSAVQVGEGVVAIGDPFGLSDTVTTGVVSALGRTITAPDRSPISDAIQTDAAINHGNSGGPLFDLHGRVIGVTAQIESESGGNDGVGFAVPSTTVRTVVNRLLRGAT